MNGLLPWGILITHILLLLALDFFVLHKKGEVTSTSKAIKETIFFVINAMLFCGVIYWMYSSQMVPNAQNYSPTQAVLTYLTGYMIELSLSVDNLFVIAVIFAGYKIPAQYQLRLLFLGILGALIFRALLIGVGIALIHKFAWLMVVFGLFLLFTAFKMLKNEEEDAEAHTTKGIARFFNISKIIDGEKFRTTHNGKQVFTALFGALISIEFTDLLFALDSIPAIFAVTTDPFLVFSSNIFAIMGLRSLYFFLASMLEKFKYLKYSVFSILVFVSLKLITHGYVDIPSWFSLVFIFISLAMGVWISIQKLNDPEKAGDL